jgi:hypothetical protein
MVPNIREHLARALDALTRRALQNAASLGYRSIDHLRAKWYKDDPAAVVACGRLIANGLA